MSLKAGIESFARLTATIDGAYGVNGALGPSVEANQIVTDVAVRHTATLIDAHRAELAQIRNDGQCVDHINTANPLKAGVNGQYYLVLCQNKIWHHSPNSPTRIRSTADQTLIV